MGNNTGHTDAAKLKSLLASRNSLMQRMKDAGCNYTQVGKVFNVSRERVRQILGVADLSVSDDPKRVTAILDDFKNSSMPFREIGRRNGVNYSWANRIVRDNLSWGEYAKFNGIRRRRRILDRLSEFCKTLNGNKQCVPTDLMNYNLGLHHAISIRPNADQISLFAELGIEYHPGMKKGRNGPSTH